jgi:phosphoribosylanthranilate isomerase
MTRTRIKICGITNAADAAAAVSAGADAVGVIFARSPRQVSVAQAAEALADVPPGVGRIGVFVDALPADVFAAISACGLTAVQFSGSESPEDCDAAGVPVIKALRVGTDFGSAQMEPYRDHAAALLLDTFVADKAGGTSQTFDWHSAGDIPGWAPTFVAGGLTPENVAACVAVLRPFAVDVSSGVESAPGVKNHQRIAEFCAAVRRADQEVYR